MTYTSKKKGFTLVEALIAITIFVILGTLISTVYVFNVRNYNQIKAQKELVDDAQFIVERIAKELQSSTIDYEEYFNMVALDGGSNYGDNYGNYATAFYSEGINTGQNPNAGEYISGEWDMSSAVCDTKFVDGESCGKDIDYYKYDELYLISGDGSYKTMFKFAEIDGEFSYLKMNGIDGDGNGVMESFECAAETPCDGEFPVDADFISLVSPRTEIVALKFFISPLEDPRKAFAEDRIEVQMQPHVTILLTVKPKDEAGLLKSDVSFTLQTTVSSRVQGEVFSYQGP
jgi:prepilin-type N-terminal cleavage/methylation domain-containing protein